MPRPPQFPLVSRASSTKSYPPSPFSVGPQYPFVSIILLKERCTCPFEVRTHGKKGVKDNGHDQQNNIEHASHVRYSTCIFWVNIALHSKILTTQPSEQPIFYIVSWSKPPKIGFPKLRKSMTTTTTWIQTPQVPPHHPTPTHRSLVADKSVCKVGRHRTRGDTVYPNIGC